MIKQYNLNPESIPQEIKKELTKQGWREGKVITKKQFVAARKNAGWTYHECSDLKSFVFLPTTLHTVSYNGIGHVGGISILKAAKMYEINNIQLSNFVRRYA